MPSSVSIRQSRPAPDLALLMDFTNTVELAAGTDEFAEPRGLRMWLAAHGLPGARAAISDAQLARAVAIREGLRALALANSGDVVDKPALKHFQKAASEVVLSPVVRADGSLHMQSRASGVEDLLARLLVAVHAAMLDGSWDRVKVCRNDECKWLFYDRSRNRSGTWCDMAACGNVMKARAYRKRMVERRRLV